jgi:hypothetical protein
LRSILLLPWHVKRSVTIEQGASKQIEVLSKQLAHLVEQCMSQGYAVGAKKKVAAEYCQTP